MKIVNPPNPEKIRQMFSQVAAKYDCGNNVLSMGIHHLWRKAVVQWAETEAGDSVLDCATGTGDLAIEFKKAVGPEGKVIGTDFCQEMLDSAPKKAELAGLNIHFEIADVMNLQYRDSSFDISSISFGIRNVQDPVKAISEMARVTKPGGYVMVLEFGQMRLPGVAQLYNFYSEKILPRIGGVITGQTAAYQYLQKSSAAFPCREEFVQLMKSTDQFIQVDYKPVAGGIAYIYRGQKK